MIECVYVRVRALAQSSAASTYLKKKIVQRRSKEEVRVERDGGEDEEGHGL